VYAARAGSVARDCGSAIVAVPRSSDLQSNDPDLDF
jgi:hypothetical protein